MPRETHFVAALALIAYLGIALGVTNLYPFSTFPMYSSAAFTSGARLVVLDEDGEVHEIREYTDWSCPGLEPIDWTMCPDGQIGQPAGYLNKEATDYIEANSRDNPAARAVELVIRVWRLSPEGGEARQLDCPIQACEAVLR